MTGRADTHPTGTGHDADAVVAAVLVENLGLSPEQAVAEVVRLKAPADRVSDAAPAPEYERAIAIQRGVEPAITARELVDAIRQDTAGAGACLSSLRFLSKDWPEAEAERLTFWVDRLGFHLASLEDKCSLALAEAERSNRQERAPDA